MPARFGAFLPSAYAFDVGLFGLSEAEALMADPQQRLLLELSHEALAAAAGGRTDGSGGGGGSGEVGAFVGISTPDYSDIKKAHTPIGVYSATGSAVSVAAGRLSFTFGLKGPSVAVDTACSSSLVGTHMALRCLAQEVRNVVSRTPRRSLLTTGSDLLERFTDLQTCCISRLDACV